MSNLNALRGALKKLGANAAQFFTPPALRTPGTAPMIAPDEGPDEHFHIRQANVAQDRAPDVVLPEWDSSVAINGYGSTMSASLTEADVRGAPIAVTGVASSPFPRPEAGPDVREFDDALLASTARTTLDERARSAVSSDHAAARGALTAQQRAVACALVDERQLVIAGPGTGKTFTVIRRLEYLLGPGGLDPSQILVLSFSRSAVREIRTRLRVRVADDDAHGDLDFLQVRTFDSFAYHLLEEVGQTPGLSANSYEQNIQAASRLITKPASDAREVVAGLRHLIVDELQDLVGVRALLVENILKAMEGGFTLLGDPAQAIYDYQARQTGGPTASSFLHWLRVHGERWHLQERSLSMNLRGSKECFAVSERHRPTLLMPYTSHEALGPLRADLEALPDVGTVSELDDSLRHLPHGYSAAILCRTNSEALQVHMHLLEQEIPHVLAVNAEDVGLPAWVGRVFSTWTGPDIVQPQFGRLWNERTENWLNIDPTVAWNALVRAAGKPDGTRRLRMEELRKVLGGRPELPGDRVEGLAPITVSTIHRAKGREYDWVIVLDGAPRSARVHAGRSGRTQDAEEARVLYVAATRARRRLNRLRRGNLGRLITLMGHDNVILPDGDVLAEVGVQGDVDSLAGVSPSRFPNVSAVSIAQDCLWDMAAGGVPRTVDLIRERPGWKYTIRRADGITPLGQMSSDFGEHMKLLSLWLSDEIGDLHEVPVRSIQTALLPRLRDDAFAPYDQSGMYLTLRLQGAVFAGKRGAQ